MIVPLLVLFSTVGITSARPEILNKNEGSRILGPSVVTVANGGRVSLTCFINVNDLPNRTMLWYKDSTLLTNGNVRNGIKIYKEKSEIGTKSILVIKDITGDESGTYSCVATKGSPSTVRVNVLGTGQTNDQQKPPTDNNNNNNNNNQKPPTDNNNNNNNNNQKPPTDNNNQKPPTDNNNNNNQKPPDKATTTVPPPKTTKPTTKATTKATTTPTTTMPPEVEETRDYDTSPEVFYISSTTTELPLNIIEDEEFEPYTEENLLNTSTRLFSVTDDEI